MKTFSKLGCFAAVTALLLSGLGTTVLAQEQKMVPTVVIDGVHYLPRCLEDETTGIMSTVLTDDLTVKEYLGARPLSMFLENNDLEGLGITEDYVFPKGKLCFSV